MGYVGCYEVRFLNRGNFLEFDVREHTKVLLKWCSGDAEIERHDFPFVSRWFFVKVYFCSIFLLSKCTVVQPHFSVKSLSNF